MCTLLRHVCHHYLRKRERERSVLSSSILSFPFAASVCVCVAGSLLSSVFSSYIPACSCQDNIGALQHRIPSCSVESLDGMSSSRKEFDVKQILRIRWRWFGHPTSPPPHSQPPLGDFFSGRGTAGSSGDLPSVSGCSPAIGSARNGNSTGSSSAGNVGGSVGNLNNRKFGDSGSSQSSGPVPTGATACPRSYSQQECRSPPALPWVPPPHSRSVLGVTTEVVSTNPSVENATGDEDNNNNVDSDSSSCR